MELIEFLAARLAEDERIALAASPGPWSENAEADQIVAVDGIAVADGFALSGQQLRATVSHIARNDPARVLREVAAKQRIAELHEIVWRDISYIEDGSEVQKETPVCGLCVPRHSAFMSRSEIPEGPCATVRLLASVYSDHPDYLKEWEKVA